MGVGRPDFARGSAPSGRTVTVTGTGSVESVPNQAGLSVGVSSDAATAQAALAANADKAANVIEALRAAGVAKPDLQTTDVTVSPRWDNRGRQDGFTAHSSVQVKVASVSRAGAIIDAAVAAGATETSGPSFDRSDRSAALPQRAEGGLRRRAWEGGDARGRGRREPRRACSGSRSRPACRPMPLFSAAKDVGDAGRARHDRGAGDGHGHLQPLVTGRPSCSHSLHEPG